jgi:hypothetical protein
MAVAVENAWQSGRNEVELLALQERPTRRRSMTRTIHLVGEGLGRFAPIEGGCDREKPTDPGSAWHRLNR